MSDVTNKSEPLHVRMVPAFIKAIRTVFQTMAQVEVSVLDPYVKTAIREPYDVSGIIGFTGALHGSAILSFSQATAMELVARFAGMRIEPNTADFADAVGELTNMVAGTAKSMLGETAGISTPLVVIGASHSMPPLRDLPCLVIPCRCAFGEFSIELNVKRQARADAA